jgi:hypothetical protein
MHSTHYAGALRIRQGPKLILISAGWAACCSGPRTEKIRALGHNTYDRSKVTCEVCLKRMAAADKTELKNA